MPAAPLPPLNPQDSSAYDPNNPNPFGNPGGPAPIWNQDIVNAPPPPGVGQLQEGVNDAFSDYSPQTGVGGGFSAAANNANAQYWTPPPPPQAGPPQGGGAPGWMDISRPGMAEQAASAVIPQLLDDTTRGTQWAADNPNAFAETGAGEQFWEGQAGHWNNRPVATNNAQKAFDSYEMHRPELSANLDPYYSRARERTSEDMNSALAARGAFNSSRGIQHLNDAMGNLSADQAKAEADYSLRRDQSALNWATGGANAARGADVSSLGAGQLDLQQLLGYGGLAFDAQDAQEGRDLNAIGLAMGLDSQELTNQLGAVNVGAIGQGAREGRIGMGFDLISGLGANVADDVGKNNQAVIEQIMVLDEQIQALYMAGKTQEAEKLQQDRANLMSETGGVIDMAGGLVGLGA